MADKIERYVFESPGQGWGPAFAERKKSVQKSPLDCGDTELSLYIKHPVDAITLLRVPSPEAVEAFSRHLFVSHGSSEWVR